MNKYSINRKIISLILSLAMVAGTLFVTASDRLLADDAKPEITVGFDDVDTGNSWYLKTEDSAKITGTYYKGIVTVDGKNITIPIEKQGNKLVIWSTFFDMIEKPNSWPDSEFKISKGTVFTQIDPNKYGNWIDIVEGGQTLVIANDLVVQNLAGAWVVPSTGTDTVEIGMSFKLVDTADSWYLKADGLDKVTGQYYMGTVTIDGQETVVPFNRTEDGFVIWSTLFDVIAERGATAPKETLEIAEGMTLTQIDPDVTGWKTPVEGGQTLKTVKALTCKNTSKGWADVNDMDKEPVYTTLGFDMVEVDDSWYLTTGGLEQIKGQYFKATILIDGEDHIIPIERQGNKLVIWADFFTTIDPTSAIPQKTLQIPAGTVFYQTNPTVTGWNTFIDKGETIITTNVLTVKKENIGWTTGKGVETTVVKFGDSIGLYNVGTENECFSLYIGGPNTLKNADITLKGNVKADGKERECVIWFPGNGEMFFYTDGAKKSIVVDKNTDFVSIDKKTVVRFNKTYLLDMQEGIAYEPGKKPTEKKAQALGLKYNRLVGTSFMFSWSMANKKIPKAGWYKTEAVVDGVTKTVLIEYTTFDDAFFIYTNCFNETPVEGDAGYPRKTLQLKKGTKLTPITVGTWAYDITGQPYTLSSDLSVTKNGEAWMDSAYLKRIEKMEPLKVKIVFKQIMNAAAVFEVVTEDGKSIDSTYGDWTTARGMLKRGVQNDDTKKYTYSGEYAAYSITGTTFYVDNLRLNELEGLQIDKGTILYPDADCKSERPIKITNQVRIVRDKEDEWTVDTSFTTEMNVQATVVNEEEQSAEEETVVVATDKTDASMGDKTKNYRSGNIVYHTGNADEEATIVISTDDTDHSGTFTLLKTEILLAIGGIFLVLAAGVFVIVRKKNKKKA